MYYLVAHVVVTAAAFLWLYVRHPPTYRRFRNVMVVITLSGMVVHLVLPLAPPRMFPNLGFVDTARVFGPASYGAGQPVQGLRQPVRGDAVAALRVGAGDRVGGARSRRRASGGSLVLAHPVITLAAIVLTANHYWLDAVVATFLFAVALGVDHFFERRRKRKDARIGERRNACAGSTNCWIGDRLTAHVPSGSTACPGPDIGGVLPVVQHPRLTSASMPGVGQVAVAARSAARSVEGMAADSWVPGVTDT